MADGTISAMRASNLGLVGKYWHVGIPVIAVAFLSSALSIGSSNYAFGFYVDPLEDTFSWSRTDIGFSLSLAAIASLTTPYIGRLMDTYGARPIMVGSLLLLGISFVIRPLMTELWHLYALSIVQFAAFSGTNVLPMGRLVGLWFPNARGRVMGIAMMGNNFGGLTIPKLTTYLLVVSSWQFAFLVTGLIAFAIAAMALFIVRERPKSIETAVNGLAQKTTQRTSVVGLTVRQVLRTSTFYYMTIATALGAFTYSALLPHISTHLIDEGTDSATVGTLFALLAACGMGGKVVFGFLSDKYSARHAMMLSLGGQTVFITFIALFPTGVHLWILVPIFGFFFGAYGVLVTLLVQECFGLKYFGSVSGVSGIVAVVPTVVGPLIAGASSDHLGSYAPAFIGVAITFVIAIVLLTQVRRPLETLLEENPA